MKRYIWIALLLSLLTAATVYAAAGSVTEAISWVPGQNTKKVTISWTSGTAGEGVPDTTVISPLNGYLRRVEAHTNGTINPTADYDVYLKDHTNGSTDLFGSFGENIPVAGKAFVPSHYNGSAHLYPVYSATPHVFSHLNSTVNSAAGEVILYVEVPR